MSFLRQISLTFGACLLFAGSLVDSHSDSLGDTNHYGKGGEHDLQYDHEAFLGKEQAAEFDKLSPEQSKARLKKLIVKIDINGDGFVTEDELTTHVNFMQNRYINQSVNTAWNHWSEHEPEKIADGKVSWDEYKLGYYGKDGDPVFEVESNRKLLENDRRRWIDADADKDDNLTREEYACFLHPEDCVRMHDSVTTERMEKYDVDKDGSVSMKEYIDHVYVPTDYPELKGQEPDWVALEREQFTDVVDKNKDGKLDYKEMKEWFFPPGYDAAAAEAHHLIGEADDNKDEKLTAEEILAHHEVFVGSQTTDYGEQLKKHDPSEF